MGEAREVTGKQKQTRIKMTSSVLKLKLKLNWTRIKMTSNVLKIKLKLNRRRIKMTRVVF